LAATRVGRPQKLFARWSARGRRRRQLFHLDAPAKARHELHDADDLHIRSDERHQALGGHATQGKAVLFLVLDRRVLVGLTAREVAEHTVRANALPQIALGRRCELVERRGEPWTGGGNSGLR
jgi:hypothetical protein